MTGYVELAQRVVAESDIAAMVLLSAENDDLEMWPLRPHPCAATPANEFARRKLRPVGVVGVSGLQSRCVFKEALPETVVAAIAQAFGAYCGTLVDYKMPADDSAEWCERLFQLEDPRPYPHAN